MNHLIILIICSLFFSCTSATNTSQSQTCNEKMIETIEQHISSTEKIDLDKQTIKLIQQTVDKHIANTKSKYWLRCFKKRNLALFFLSITVTVAIAIPCTLLLAEKLREKKMKEEQENLNASITQNCIEKLSDMEQKMVALAKQTVLNTDQSITEISKEMQTLSLHVNENIAACYKDIAQNKAAVEQSMEYIQKLTTQLAEHKQLSSQNVEKIKENMQILAAQSDKQIASCLKAVEDNTAMTKQHKEHFANAVAHFQIGLQQMNENVVKATDECVKAIINPTIDTSDLTPSLEDYFEGLNVVAKTVSIIGGIASTLGGIESVVSGNNNYQSRNSPSNDDVALQKRFEQLKGSSTPKPLSLAPKVEVSKGWGIGKLFKW